MTLLFDLDFWSFWTKYKLRLLTNRRPWRSAKFGRFCRGESRI